MSREEAHSVYGYSRNGQGHTHITIEQAAGIGILIVILGILLLISCWYWRRRSGYRSLKEKSFPGGTKGTLIGRYPCEHLGHQDGKLPFQENNSETVVPNAPPAYEKVSSEQSPPPYSL
ncbi:melanoma antigen recognized by T-cells 1 [Erinaceus europaeus]|uniref:Melanoma antigen recognized by T-cells 1 n=1 Tax=Erinaceus europaeus TaxID=9365 RepID=A0A1S3AJY5_ERIEU|nr:melanoma antigen recognized by T-cells 1 [Erinaceus europaeus]